jgi:hypothetical protein
MLPEKPHRRSGGEGRNDGGGDSGCACVRHGQDQCQRGQEQDMKGATLCVPDGVHDDEEN